jgi:CheY-like chemotaxis protein
MGEEALSVLLQGDIISDLIFSELDMPKMNGFQILDKLKSIEQFRTIPIIIYTADYSESQIQKAKAHGGAAIYSKTRVMR